MENGIKGQSMTTHDEIMAELKEMRDDVRPLVTIAPDLKAMAEIYAAGKVGGGAVKWLAMLGASLTAIWVALKALAGTLVTP